MFATLHRVTKGADAIHILRFVVSVLNVKAISLHKF